MADQTIRHLLILLTRYKLCHPYHADLALVCLKRNFLHALAQ
jgi:hypothetical protein